MKNRALISALAVALLGAAAEASAQDRVTVFAQAYAGKLCTTPKCTIDVMVGPNCQFTVTPWTLGIPSGSHNVKIHWKLLKGSNAEFDEYGIYFKTQGSANEFDTPKRLGSNNDEFMWNDKNPKGSPKARPFSYGIRVRQGGHTCHYDPTIVNDY